MLPFEGLETEFDVVEGIKIPKLRDVTVGEEMAIRKLFTKYQDPEAQKLYASEIDVLLQAGMVAILLRRVDESWTLEKTMAEVWELPQGKVIPTMKIITGLYEWFFKGERERWKPPTESPPEPEGSGSKKTGKNS